MKEGDIIVLTNGLLYDNFLRDVDRKQIITKVTEHYIYAKFLDVGYINKYLKDSYYIKNCIITGSSNDIIYGNGVPMEWEDEI